MIPSKTLVVDIETTGLDIRSDSWRIGSIWRDGAITTIGPVEPSDWGAGGPWVFLERLTEEIKTAKYLVGHNLLGFDLPFLMHHAPKEYERFMTQLEKRFFQDSEATLNFCDTLILHKIYNNKEQGNSLEDLARDFGLQPKVQIDDWNAATEEELAARCERDVALNAQVFAKLFPHCYEDEIWEHHNRYLQLCLAMAHNGLPVDKSRLDEETKRLKTQVFRKKLRLFGLYNTRFNPNSSKQCEEFANLRGGTLPKTDDGNPSLNKKLKDKIISSIPEFEDIFSIREDLSILSKVFGDGKHSLRNSYINDDYDTVRPIYRPYHQIGMRTSIVEPSIGTIPKKCRGINYMPEFRWVGLDIGALEVNVLAQLIYDATGEATLLDEVKNTSDFKANTRDCLADYMYNTPEEKQLDIAKRVFFAKVYGSGPAGLAHLLRVPESDGPKISQLLFNRAPGLQELTTNTQREWEETEEVYNYYGYVLRPRSAHAALNAVIQSTGAIYSNILLGALHREFERSDYCLIPVIHCHDECQWIYPDNYEKRIKAVIPRLVANTYEYLEWSGLHLFARLNIDHGKSWLESH